MNACSTWGGTVGERLSGVQGRTGYQGPVLRVIPTEDNEGESAIYGNGPHAGTDRWFPFRQFAGTLPVARHFTPLKPPPVVLQTGFDLRTEDDATDDVGKGHAQDHHVGEVEHIAQSGD